MPKELVDMLNSVASNLGATVVHLWPTIVAAMFYRSISGFLTVMALTVASFLLSARFYKQVMAIEEERGYRKEYNVPASWLLGFSIAGLSIMAVIDLVFVPGLIAGIFSPEGQTVIFLLGK